MLQTLWMREICLGPTYRFALSLLKSLAKAVLWLGSDRLSPNAGGELPETLC